MDQGGPKADCLIGQYYSGEVSTNVFCPKNLFQCQQEAQRVLEAARREGTGWVKVDQELISKVDTALENIATTLKKAERENSSLYFQV